MCVVWRGDDNQMDFLDGEKIIQISNDSNVGIFPGCFAAAPLQNSGKMQIRHGANHRRVKRTPGETESNEANFNHREPSFCKSECSRVSNFRIPGRRVFSETRSCLKEPCPAEWPIAYERTKFSYPGNGRSPQLARPALRRLRAERNSDHDRRSDAAHFYQGLTKTLIGSIPGKLFVEINKQVGFRLITKAGQTGSINVMKASRYSMRPMRPKCACR